MPGPLEDELGDVLEKSRDGKGWTQSDLAHASGISVSDVSRMERYEYVPDESILKNLAQVLDLHAPSLIPVPSIQSVWICLSEPIPLNVT